MVAVLHNGPPEYRSLPSPRFRLVPAKQSRQRPKQHDVVTSTDKTATTIGSLSPALCSDSPATSIHTPVSQRNIFESLRSALRVAQDRRLSNSDDLHTIVRLEISAPAFLDDDHLRRELEAEFGRVRLSWDGDLERMIIKAMPTAPHEGSHRELALLFVIAWGN